MVKTKKEKVEKITLGVTELARKLMYQLAPQTVDVFSVTLQKISPITCPMGQVFKYNNFRAFINCESNLDLVMKVVEAGFDAHYFDPSHINPIQSGWAIHVRGPIWKHKKNKTYYIRLMQDQVIGKGISFRNKKGKIINMDDLKNFLPPQKEGNKYVYFLMRLDNIRHIKVGNILYTIKKEKE